MGVGRVLFPLHHPAPLHPDSVSLLRNGIKSKLSVYFCILVICETFDSVQLFDSCRNCKTSAFFPRNLTSSFSLRPVCLSIKHPICVMFRYVLNIDHVHLFLQSRSFLFFFLLLLLINWDK